MFHTGQILDGLYQVGEKIGQGGTGIVYAGWHLRLNKSIVIKRLQGTHNARAEADVLKNLHHRGLPQVYDFITVGGEVYTIMDFIPGVSLDRLIEQGTRIDTKTAVNWMDQLLDVLDYLHTRSPMILHNDIKPGNIILKPGGELCLIDFNISMYADSGAITGYTAGYASPEQAALAQQLLYRQPVTITLDARSDLYSLGASFYELVSGVRPTGQGPMPPLRSARPCPVEPAFAEIIDRAMSWRRELRYASARKMRGALQKYRRYRGHYRTYLAAQTLCWSVGVLLIAAGVYFLSGSVRQQQIEYFQGQYRQYTRTLEAGNSERAAGLAEELLSDPSCVELLEENTDVLCALLHETGNYYYDLQEYETACRYYRQAVDALPPGDETAAAYTCDAAMAAAQAGWTDTALSLLEQAQASGTQTGSLLLAQAAVYAVRQQETDCLNTVTKLLEQTGSDPEQAQLAAKACLLAAEAAPSTQEKLLWLQKARAYQEDRTVLRQLGAAAYNAYLEKPDSGRSWLELSEECWRILCAGGYPTRRDRLNLAAVQMTLGRLNACRETLTALDAQFPGDYEVLAELALLARVQGEKTACRQYLNRAAAAWEGMTPDQQAAVPQGLREQFEELRQTEGG